jgi:HK97 family phage portal protein
VTAREIVASVGNWIARAAEGQYRPGPYVLPVTGGVLSATAGSYMNWWQLGHDPQSMSSQSVMVEACVGAYAQTIAMCPGDHWRVGKDGGRDRVTTSSLSRILKRPNEYSTISDFLLTAVRSLYLDGNAYALALRNSRQEIIELHLMDSAQSAPMVATTGDIFYRLGGNDIIEKQIGKIEGVPARDVLHIRLHSGRRKKPYPLVGETPLVAALMDMAATSAIINQQIQYYLNSARPSAVLSTDAILKPEQVAQLRALWTEQAKGLEAGCGAGGTPILTAGLKVVPWSAPARDAQLAEFMKMSDDKIALAFRVPLAILGVGGLPTFNSIELLMGSWISSGLGFALNHIEEAFGLTFELRGQPDEYLEFNTAALLRSAFKDRIDGLAKAVLGGVLSPNEARAIEGYPAVKFGDEPRLQAQVVPLSAATLAPAAPSAPSAPAADKPADKPDDKPDDKPADDTPPVKAERHSDDVARLSRTLTRAADRHARRRNVA